MAGSWNNFVPKFTLWSSDGSTLIYTFPAVNFTNAPQTVPDVVEITNLRSKCGIIIDGGNDKPWDLQLNFILSGKGYVNVTDEIESLISSVETKTPYILRIERSDTLGDYFEYNVKRIVPFTFQESLRRNIQPVVAIFRANSW